MHRYLLVVILISGLFAACNRSPRELAVIPLPDQNPTRALQPTPTLVAALQTVVPVITPDIASTATNNPAVPTTTPGVTATDSASTSASTAADTFETSEDQRQAEIEAAQSPTPIPAPAILLPAAQRQLNLGNYEVAHRQLQTLLNDPRLNDRQRAEAYFVLGRVEQLLGRSLAANDAFLQHLALGNPPRSEAYYFLAEAALSPEIGNINTANSYFQQYLAVNPDMGAYIFPRLAELNPDQTVALYEAALDKEAQYLVHFRIHQRLSQIHLNAGNYPAAIREYETMRDLARTEQTKGEMSYRIGATYVLSGSTSTGYDAFLFGVNNYPQSYESYLGLVELVEAEVPVDQFQRGLVDYYAKAYLPAVTAFQTHISETVDYQADTHLYLAWSYEGIGDMANALDQMEAYRAQAGEGWDSLGVYYKEKAALQTRSIAVSDAINTLTEFVAGYPQHEEAAWAAQRIAVLADRFQQNGPAAIDAYRAYVTAYPRHDGASEAYFRIGALQWSQGFAGEAIAAWTSAAAYDDEFGHAALVWLIRTAEDPQPFVARAAAVNGDDYYTIRAQSLGLNEGPYTPATEISLDFDEDAGRQATANWIRRQFAIEGIAVTSDLDPKIAADGRLIRGRKLWALGLKSEAKQELEDLRLDYREDPRISYQLALEFRDIGLYRSSILAAATVIARSGATIFDVPPLLARLSYPIYYEDVVLPLTESYGYDPLLQFALIRQESLYESFIASSAAAQGLSQIIPDTGVYISNQLGWQDYENSDLNKPYINLTFGSFYLDQQLDLFEGEVAPALAAYNAGPGNAIKWHNSAGDDHDLYLETVNFAETRTYIRNIYVGQAIYRYLYGVNDVSESETAP